LDRDAARRRGPSEANNAPIGALRTSPTASPARLVELLAQQEIFELAAA
jgi:hypothetical protein